LILFSSVCASVCLSVHSKPLNQTVGELNANSSKTATAITNIKFDAHVSRYCTDVFP